MNQSLFKPLFFVLMICTVLFSPYSVADVQGKLIAYNCYSCHGKKLKNLNLSQPLNETELIQMLLAFKYDKKIVTIMNRISKGYTDSKIKSVAQYISQSQ
jgi:cytochrome c553